MKKKTLFVFIQVSVLVIIGVVVSTVAIASSQGSPDKNHQSQDPINAVIISESSSATPTSAPTASEAPTPEIDPITSNPRYGKTNEDSPLYQQCLVDLQAARANYEAQTAQHNDYYRQLNAEYMDVTSRSGQYAFGTAEFDALSSRASELMALIQSGSNPIAVPSPINWGCGYSGKFYF